MHQHVLQVHKHPLAAIQSFHAKGPLALLLAPLDDVFRQRTHVPIGGAAGDDHRIGDSGQTADVQDPDVLRLQFVQRLRDGLGGCCSAHSVLVVVRA